MGIVIFLVVLALVIAAIAVVSHIMTKKAGERFLAAHPDAVRVCRTASRGQFLFSLHKDYKGRYSRFHEGKESGILLLPGVAYNLRVQWRITRGNRTTTITKDYMDLALEAGKIYAVSYDETTKAFSLREKGAEDYLYPGAKAVRQKKIGSRARDEFIAQHPDAVSMLIRPADRLHKLDIPKIDGGEPVRFKDQDDRGILLIPGREYTLNLLCEVGVQGVGSASRKIYTEAVKLTPVPQKGYTLEFDDATHRFVIS